MQVSQSSHIIYEQPLSERIRTFLRLEFLFHRARYLLEHESPWASRLTFEVLIDVMAVFSRADLKKEIIKELERHAATLEALSRNPNVAQERLEEIRGKVQVMLRELHERESVPGHELRHNELLNAVRQRSSIPAGTCDFDLPAFHSGSSAPAANVFTNCAIGWRPSTRSSRQSPCASNSYAPVPHPPARSRTADSFSETSARRLLAR